MSNLKYGYRITSLELLDNLTLEINFNNSKATVEFSLEILCHRDNCPCVFSQIIFIDDPSICIGKHFIALYPKESTYTMEYYNILVSEQDKIYTCEFKIPLPNSNHKTNMHVRYS